MRIRAKPIIAINAVYPGVSQESSCNERTVNLFKLMLEVTQSPVSDQKIPDQTLLFPSSAGYFQTKDDPIGPKMLS